MEWFEMYRGFQSRQALFAIAAVMVTLVGSSRLARRRSTDVHKRGVVLLERSPRRPAAGALTLAGVAVPLLDETKHFKMIGTTGTGKSTVIRELLGAALARGDRAVFADPDGGYRERFFNRYRGDVVLNPFERDSVQWDPFAEIGDSYDIEELAAGLIPSSEDAASNEWRGYARTLLAAVVRHCLAERCGGARESYSRGAAAGCDVVERHGMADGCVAAMGGCGELWRLLSIAPVEELRSVVAGTPAQSFLDPDNARMFGSIRSVATSALAALDYIRAQRSSPFSIRRWVRHDTARGVLFIPYKAGQIAALRAMIATWMRIAIFEAMNGREDCDQRLWFVIDELDALGAIEGLKDALARLRKFGGRCVLGLQSIAQVSGTYGVAGAQTVVENCGNTLILRCSSGENGGTAQFASKLIGDREVVRRQTSRGSDREGAFPGRGMRRSKNISEQHVTEAAVLPSQIEQLADLSGYLKLASSPAWRRVDVKLPRRVVR